MTQRKNNYIELKGWIQTQFTSSAVHWLLFHFQNSVHTLPTFFFFSFSSILRYLVLAITLRRWSPAWFSVLSTVNKMRINPTVVSAPFLRDSLKINSLEERQLLLTNIDIKTTNKGPLTWKNNYSVSHPDALSVSLADTDSQFCERQPRCWLQCIRSTVPPLPLTRKEKMISNVRELHWSLYKIWHWLLSSSFLSVSFLGFTLLYDGEKNIPSWMLFY